MASFDLLVIGEINPDLVLRGTDLVPRFGQAERLVEDAQLTIGSSSVIMACAAARLGLRTRFAGVVGEDTFGQFMLEAMRTRDVDTSACIVDAELATGVSVILSHGDDRAILTHLGAIPTLAAEQVPDDVLRSAMHVHVGGFFLLDRLRPGLARLFQSAREAGITTSLDTNWDPSERWNDDLEDVLRHTDVVFPNEREALRMARADDLSTAIRVLGQSASTVVVKRGAQGAIASRSGQEARVAAFDVSVVDTTGAGDTFDAGFVYGFVREWELERSLRLAAACGALSTRALGGTQAQPSLEEALALVG